jgi:hypothetical protein
VTKETKFSITSFTREKFENYKKIQEIYGTKVYEVIVEFDLKDNGFFTLLTSALSGDTTIDEIIKKCKTEEVVTYETIGEEKNLSIESYDIKLQFKAVYFKQLIKGVFKSFKFNKVDESYAIKFEGELLSATLEYTKEEEKQKNGLSK